MEGMDRPNLFSFATKELSQDAFICWLLSWAKPENKDLDANLHACGVALIHKFFEKQGKISPEIKSIEVKRQFKNIDALCIVNDEFPIIIEDKTTSKNHSGQLVRYFDAVKDLKDKNKNPRYKPENIICIYFKTHDQANYINIKDTHKYQPFTRKDFLTILDEGLELGIEDNIFQDYRACLVNLEKGVQSYLHQDLNKWSSNSWVGFYSKLQQEFDDSHWDKVNNPAKGFMAFNWGKVGAEKPYLQLENSKLCFKIHVEAKHIEKSKLTAYRRTRRNKWFKLIQNHCADFGIDLIEPNFGNGKWMTVIIAKDDYRQIDAEDRIDIDSTVQYLQKMDAFLKEMQKLDIT